MNQFHHVSVLLEESVQALAVRPEGTYIDGTLGGAGHAGQVARRHSSAPDYRNDGRYAAGSNGRVAGSGDSHRSRDLTRDARDFVRDTGDAAKDLGNGLRKAARDIGDGMADAAREY